MKKNLYIILILSLLLLAGCSKKDQMTNFIPTSAPGQQDVSNGDTQTDTQADTPTETVATPTPKTIHVGQTTKMYVKLDEYGAFLNIRSTPSTDGKQVGFLVHAEEVDVIEIADGWASFLYDNAICYVNADFLVDECPDYLDPPTPTPAPKNTKTPTPKPNGTTPDI